MKLDKNYPLPTDKLFFTSDTHFYHENIIKYCDRPFENVWEMNKVLVENWNNKVPKDGIVFHLGDVSLRGTNKLSDLLYSLNGEIHLIKGNHEKDALRVKDRWKTINDILEIFVIDDEISYGSQHIVMCHFPFITWNASHRGSWNLFGHVHGKLVNKHSPTQLDVGVDVNNFTPISYQEIKEQITKQSLNIKPI